MNMINGIRSLAEQSGNRLAHARHGIVSSYDGQTHRAKVLIQPENVETGWLPVSTMLAGAQAIYTGLVPGSQVMLLPQEGDADSYTVVGGIFDDIQPPPMAPSTFAGAGTRIQPGETIIVGPNASSLRMCADGSILIKPGTVLNVDGPIHASGNISSDMQVVDLKGALDVLRPCYNQHEHPSGFNTPLTGQTTKPV